MKKLIKICCVLLLSFSLVGCGRSDLNSNEMREDYDSMWQIIENNYAQMGMAKRITNKDFQVIKATYRDKITDKTTPMQFDAIINQCLNEFEGVGRMGKLDERTYTETLRYLKDNELSTPHLSYLYDVINIRKSKEYYGYPYDGSNNENKIKKNLTTSIVMEDHIAYFKMNTMSSEFMDKDSETLKKFLKKVQNYDACIIDLRGVSEGNDLYWRKNIVPMNITKDMQYSTYELLKGDESSFYLKSEYKLHNLDKLPELPELNGADKENMTNFIKRKHLIPTENSKALFKGKFYILTDKETRGTAEKFVVFAKQSGFATIVGENTGGDSFGVQPLLWTLPNSGMVIGFNATNALNPDGSSNERNGSKPDIKLRDNLNALGVAIDEIQKTIVVEPPVEEEIPVQE